MSTTQSMNCDMVAELASAYAEKTLSGQETQALEAHLQQCQDCRAAIKRFRAVDGLMGFAQLDQKDISGAGAPVEGEEGELEEVGAGGVVGRLGGAPWWAVSLALHILVIALASLVSM